jgi:hypothetical protein
VEVVQPGLPGANGSPPSHAHPDDRGKLVESAVPDQANWSAAAVKIVHQEEFRTACREYTAQFGAETPAGTSRRQTFWDMKSIRATLTARCLGHFRR